MANYMMLDTETANGLDFPLVYDIGILVFNEKGEHLFGNSFIIYDIFVLEKELMQSAYYAEKIPLYEEELKAGISKIYNFLTAQKIIKKIIKKYKVEAVISHNAYFDFNALNNTLAYITKSQKRSFYPFGLPIYDTLAYAKGTLAKDDDYIQWCMENGYIKGEKTPRLTAEILYRYISGNSDFIEEHRGYEDCEIERDIFLYLLRNYPNGDKFLFKKETRNKVSKLEKQTFFQKQIFFNIRKKPVYLWG